MHSPSPQKSVINEITERAAAACKQQQQTEQATESPIGTTTLYTLQSANWSFLKSKEFFVEGKMTHRRNIHCVICRTNVAINDCGEANISSRAHNRCPVPHFQSFAVIAQSVCSAAVGLSLKMGGIGEALGGNME